MITDDMALVTLISGGMQGRRDRPHHVVSDK